MPQSQSLFYVQLLVPNVLSRRDEGSGKPCAIGQAIVNHLGLDPGTYVCSGSVVVTAYDSESGCPGSNPEWG